MELPYIEVTKKWVFGLLCPQRRINIGFLGDQNGNLEDEKTVSGYERDGG